MNNIQKIVRNKSGQTIFWGMHLLPKVKREALYTIFAFVRHLEEIVEGSLDLEEKQEILNMWRMELDNIYEKKVPATEIGRRIYKNCMRFKLPKKEFLSLIESISENIDNPLQAPTLRQLSGYCRGVGGMTGSLSLRIFGCKDESVVKELSNSLGQAFQITNILKNVKEDAQNDRLYIPHELLIKANINSTDPKSVVVDKNLAIAREELAQVASKNYQRVYEILSQLDKSTARPLKLVTDIYKKYFDVMESRGWEIISPKPQISKFCKFGILVRAVFYSNEKNKIS